MHPALARDRQRNVAFALVILQRCLASSTYALLHPLEQRKKRLEELLDLAHKGEYEARYPGDEARKLAQSCGVDVAREWGRGFVRKKKEFFRLLGPH